MVTYLGSLVQLCCGEEHCKQISLACVGSAHSVSAALGLPPLTADVCAFMVSTSQVLGCSARNCLRRALGCMHFPGLSHSGSGSWVLHEGADSVGPAFLPFSSLSSSGDQVLCQRSRPQLGAESHRLPQPSRSVFWVYHGHAFSGVPCVSSGELISGGDPPGGCRPSRIPRSLG